MRLGRRPCPTHPRPIHPRLQPPLTKQSTPVTVAAALGLMLWLIGPSALAGFAVLAVYVPLQNFLGGAQAAARRATAKVSDTRTGIMGEVLTGMRLLKVYGFEAAFAERVGSVRQEEIVLLRRSAVLRSVNGEYATRQTRAPTTRPN